MGLRRKRHSEFKIFAVNHMENPVGSWNVWALKREGSELQMNTPEKTVRPRGWEGWGAEGQMLEHTYTQQVMSREAPSKGSEREHPG